MSKKPKNEPARLIDEVDLLPDAINKGGVDSWHKILELEQPALMAQINEVCDQWIRNSAGQGLKKKFRFIADLFRWILPKLPTQVSKGQFYEYIHYRRRVSKKT